MEISKHDKSAASIVFDTDYDSDRVEIIRKL
jgi:hypothetical protein